MKLQVLGETYEFPVFDEWTTKELRVIKERTGMGQRKLMEGFSELDVDVLVSLAYVAKTRAGEKVKWEDFDDIRPAMDIDLVFDPKDEPAEEDGQSDPPTSGSTESGTSRAQGSKGTSRSSRTTSTSPPETSTT